MRIAYFAHVNGAPQSGVFHKIARQVALWRDRQVDVLPCILTRDSPEPWKHALGQSHVGTYSTQLTRLRAVDRLANRILDYGADVTYLRWDLFYPPMYALLRSAALVVEVNTDDVHEYRLGSPVRAKYNEWTRGFLMKPARAVIFVTSELASSPSFALVRGERHVISNGIDLSAYPQLPSTATGPPRLAFVSTPGQPWQGIDKLVRLARKRTDWRFDIVGTEASEGSGERNVEWHGLLSRDSVMSILARADVGVGSLALHRKGMHEACSLKMREYLAVGLPVLYAHSDPDVDGLEGVALRIPNTESNVLDDLDRIDEFVHGSRGRRVPRPLIGHIDVSEKEEQRLALFESIAKRIH